MFQVSDTKTSLLGPLITSSGHVELARFFTELAEHPGDFAFRVDDRYALIACIGRVDGAVLTHGQVGRYIQPADLGAVAADWRELSESSLGRDRVVREDDQECSEGRGEREPQPQ